MGPGILRLLTLVAPTGGPHTGGTGAGTGRTRPLLEVVQRVLTGPHHVEEHLEVGDVAQRPADEEHVVLVVLQEQHPQLRSRAVEGRMGVRAAGQVQRVAPVTHADTSLCSRPPCRRWMAGTGNRCRVRRTMAAGNSTR